MTARFPDPVYILTGEILLLYMHKAYNKDLNRAMQIYVELSKRKKTLIG